MTVVPLTGGVQGKHYTDVNHLATRLAEQARRPGPCLMHAPLFAESREQRDMLMEMASVKEVFDLARKARDRAGRHRLDPDAGIPATTTCIPCLNPRPRAADRAAALRGEFLAHLIRDDGNDLPTIRSISRLVALEPGGAAPCPRTIGVAAGPEKVRADPRRAQRPLPQLAGARRGDRQRRAGSDGANARMSHEMHAAREIGSSGIDASAIGLGTWAIGGWMWGGTDEAQSIAAIQASHRRGRHLIDTAPAYGKGLAEEIVGKAISGRRDKVVLATKCGLVWHTTQGQPLLRL